MTWLSIVFWLLTHAPDIVSLIKQFLNLIHGMPLGQREAIRSVLSERIKANDVEGAKSVVQSHCSGVGCPSDLVAVE